MTLRNSRKVFQKDGNRGYYTVQRTYEVYGCFENKKKLEKNKGKTKE